MVFPQPLFSSWGHFCSRCSCARGHSRAPPVSPTAHLEERKAQIYENLRDLQFEFRVGKLSDADYQKTKVDLQRELARVLAEIDSMAPQVKAKAATAPAPAAAKPKRMERNVRIAGPLSRSR